MRESEIEKILVREVRKLGGIAYKWVSPGNDGVPDRIVVFPHERPVFVELKTDKGRPTALQAVQIRRLEKLGQEVTVIYGMDGLSRFFRSRGFEAASMALDSKYGR